MSAWLGVLGLVAALAGCSTQLEHPAPCGEDRTPVPTCTPAAPCTRPLRLVGTAPITSPGNVPVCATSRREHPTFDDGPPATFAAPDGTVRYACVFHPPGASAAAPRPLVVFLHGSGGNAQNVYDLTLLRDKARSFDLTGDPARPGFHLVSVNARNLAWPSQTPQDGPKHDFYDQDLASPSTNPDLANLDRVIDQIAGDPAVDASRIYVMGWSNGGQFAQLYAIARHATATPGGRRIAAVAVYSAADPFAASPRRSCVRDPYPRSTVPVLVASRACDLFPCSDEQAAAFAAAGKPVEPGAVVADWMARLAHDVGDPDSKWLLITGQGIVTSTCTPAASCRYLGAVMNHLRWPDGLARGDDGRDHEPEMLEFLRAHPLP